MDDLLSMQSTINSAMVQGSNKKQTLAWQCYSEYLSSIKSEHCKATINKSVTQAYRLAGYPDPTLDIDRKYASILQCQFRRFSNNYSSTRQKAAVTGLRCILFCHVVMWIPQCEWSTKKQVTCARKHQVLQAQTGIETLRQGLTPCIHSINKICQSETWHSKWYYNSTQIQGYTFMSCQNLGGNRNKEKIISRLK